MVSRILVPTDGSDMARKAVGYAVDLAKQLNASVTVLFFIDNRVLLARPVPAEYNPTHPIEPIEDYPREAAEGYAREIKNLCEKNGIRSEIVVKIGYSVEDIVREAERSKADLIVMGSRGRGAFAAAEPGIVDYGVIHNEAKVPVLMYGEADDGDIPSRA